MISCQLYEIPKITIIPEYVIKDYRKSILSVVMTATGNQNYKEFMGQSNSYVAYQIEIDALNGSAKDAANDIINRIHMNVGGTIVPWGEKDNSRIELTGINFVSQFKYDIGIGVIDIDDEDSEKAVHRLQLQVKFEKQDNGT